MFLFFVVANCEVNFSFLKSFKYKIISLLILIYT